MHIIIIAISLLQSIQGFHPVGDGVWGKLLPQKEERKKKKGKGEREKERELEVGGRGVYYFLCCGASDQ